MTTAARPTFAPARGGTGKGEKDLSSLSKQYSSRDLPSHKSLKYRQTGQGTTEEVRSRDFRRELEERERNAREKRGTRDRDAAKRPRLDQIPASNLDADDPIEDAEAESGSSDDDDDDDTAILLAELNKIKKERAQEQAKRDSEKAVEDERIRMENIIKGNPLLNQAEKQQQQQAAAVQAAEFKVKRRWDDDVVFKNCAKGDEEIQKGKGYINDSLRSEFHKKFMEKYIK